MNPSSLTKIASTILVIIWASFSFPALAQDQSFPAPNLSKLNSAIPGLIFTGDSTFLSTLLSNLLPISITFAGLLLLLMLIRGGFTMLSNPTNPQNQDAGKQRITWALVGFFVLFASYWLAQILEIVFNVNIV